MDEIMLDLRAITDKNIQYFQCNDFEAIYKSLEFNGARPTSLKQVSKKTQSTLNFCLYGHQLSDVDISFWKSSQFG